MAKILFLAHRIPYPPDKGDKIRSWHILAHLAKRHRVYLGCYVDDPEDRKHLPFLSDVCEEVKAIDLSPGRAKIRSLRALAAGRALSVDYYRDQEMADWVDAKLTDVRFDATFVFSSPMAQFVLGRSSLTGRVVMDFVDVDSDKWRQYASSKRWPMSALYRRESERLMDFERDVARRTDASLFVSPKEAELFRQIAPEAADSIGHLNNGVDSAFFSPDQDLENPYEAGERAVVFTGAMDYWANVDAVQWFADEILPRIRAVHGDAVFYIVGGKPTAQVRALAERAGIKVTGRVPDVRPYLKFSDAVVCPLRIARGVQNKVLEGMAMARPVVASPEAFEGIDAKPGEELIVADGPADIAEAVSAILAGSCNPAMPEKARKSVVENYSWDHNLSLLDDLLLGTEAHA